MKERLKRMTVLVAALAMGFAVHAATPPSDGQTYYGLFVGVNEYSLPGCDYLLGCDWDAMRMMDAYTRGGFCDAANAELVANLDATKAVVREKFGALAAKAKAGDTVLYYQSSHGGDYTSVIEEKGAVLCMTDEEWSDVEFADDLAQFADGVRVVVVLDACFSGGMFKSVGSGATATKKAKWGFASRVQARLNARSAAAKASGTKGVPSVAWITAADWDETASMDNRGSEFSHALLAGWEVGSADTDSDGYVSFGELAEYAKGNVYESVVQSENDALLGDMLAGQDFDVDTFRLLSANNTLYGFLGECPSSVVIPEGTTSIATSIFDSDYYDVGALESVMIPASMMEIDDYAFYGCENLGTVTFGDDLNDVLIAETAFEGTPYYAVLFPPPVNDDFENAVELPGDMSGSAIGTNINASVVSTEPLYVDWDAGYTVWWKWTAPTDGPVQFNTFGSADFDTVIGVYTGSSLASLTLVADNDDAKDSSGYQSQVAFNATAGTTYYIAIGCYGNVGEIVLDWGPYDVPFSFVIADGVLTGFEGICPTSIVIPEVVTNIADEVFYNCNLLESVTFNDGLVGIGADAFAWCVSLTEVVLPASVYSIGDSAFCNCSRLLSVSYGGQEMTPDSEELNEITYVESAFRRTPWLGDDDPVVVDGLDIEDGWVSGYSGEILEGEVLDLAIPDGVEGIEDGAFEGLAGLRSLYIPASVTYIGERAFADCPNLEEVIFEEKESELIEDEDYADDDDEDWGDWNYADTGKTVKSYIGFDEPLEIGMGAFSGCEALTWLEIPAHVGYVDESAFKDCTALEEVCFLSDDSVTSSCLEIGGGAFRGCEALGSVSFDDRPYDPENDIWNDISIGESAFEGCENLTDLYLGEGVEGIGEYAFYGIGIESLEVPASVTHIGNYAFAYCESLADVYFYGEDIYGYDCDLDVDIESAFECTPWLTAPPANDNFADAKELSGETGYATGRNRNATVEEGEIHKCSPTATVWYKWTPESAGTYLFSVNADYDSILGVYIGASVNALTRVAFNDDFGYQDYQEGICFGVYHNRSVVAFDAAAGETYYIAVGGYRDSEGAFGLEWMPYEYEIEFEISEDGVLTGFDYNLIMPPTITIPEGVIAIAEELFGDYEGIVTVNLPSSLKSIGEYAFAWCYDLQTVNGLTDSVETGAFAFHMTPFDETRPFGLDVVDNCVVSFHGRPCPATLTIPENVTNIAEWAFCYDEYGRWEYDEETDEEYEISNPLANLRSVVLPDSVVSISRWAFEDCTNLVTVSIGNPEILIDGSAFNGCEGLAIAVEKVGHTLVGWDLFRENNPGYMHGYWDEVGGSNAWEYVEYEPDFMPTGTVVRVADITPLVYGMPTDQMRTNWVWNAELSENEIESIVVVTNYLEGVWATPVWEVNRYTLTFDSDGGSEVAPITQDYGTAVTAPAAPTRTGYTFAGWTPAVPETMPAEDQTLTAQWTVNRYTLTFDSDGGSEVAPITQDYGTAVTAPVAPTRTGYTFAGWTPAVPETMPAEDQTLTAQWTANQYTVKFDANGGTGTMAAQTHTYNLEQYLNACMFVRPSYEFMGWALSADSDKVAYFDGENILNLTDEAGGVITFYAVWERSTLWAPVGDRSQTPEGGTAIVGDEIFAGEAAETYDGYIQDVDGNVVGTIQVKAAKAKIDRRTQEESSALAVTIQLATEKKATVKGLLDMATGRFEEADKAGRVLSLTIGANSLSGTYGPYIIDGAQNKFTTKNSTAKELGSRALAKWQKTWSVAWEDDKGWNGLSLTVAAKGKVKVAGVLADGTKVSANSQLLVGEGNTCAIPVVVSKKVQLAFNVWLTDEGIEVDGLEGAVAGRVDALAANAKFLVDAMALGQLLGDATYADYLPNGLSVSQNGAKWIVEDGKAGKVQLAKGALSPTEVDVAKLAKNPSALKIAYTAKTGTFKGTFKAYTLMRGKPKATTVNVTGVLVNGTAYGTAMIKNVGSVPVTIAVAK